MIGSIISGIGSLFAGGATGILGSIVTNVSDFFEQRRKNQHQIENRRLDIEEMDKEYEHRKDLTAQKTDAATQQSSYEHDARAYTSGMKIESPWLKVPLVLTDMARGWVRIILTLSLVFLVWWMFLEVQKVLQQAGVQALKPQEALSLYAAIVDMILYLASTAVSWWFGTRPRSQQRKQD